MNILIQTVGIDRGRVASGLRRHTKYIAKMFAKMLQEGSRISLENVPRKRYCKCVAKRLQRCCKGVAKR